MARIADSSIAALSTPPAGAPLTGPELAAKHGFKPHGVAPEVAAGFRSEPHGMVPSGAAGEVDEYTAECEGCGEAKCRRDGCWSCCYCNRELIQQPPPDAQPPREVRRFEANLGNLFEWYDRMRELAACAHLDHTSAYSKAKEIFEEEIEKLRPKARDLGPASPDPAGEGGGDG